MKHNSAAFRRLSLEDRVAAIRGQRAERVLEVERGAIDEQARTAWLSIASDEPYARWWGVEILDMGSSSIRTARLSMGAPLLVGHDAADQVGVIERYQVGADKRLRVLARFGRSDRAEEIFRDVLDGIRRNASVGYIIHDLVLEKQEGDSATYRVTDWEPLEGSLVAVPADPTVGVGRSINYQFERGNQMEREEHRHAGAAAAGVQTTAEGERQRILSLTAAGNEYREWGGPEIAQRLIADPNGSMEMFRAHMLEAMRARNAARAPQQFGGGFGSSFDEGFRGDRPVAFGQGAREIIARSQFFKGPDAERKAYTAGHWLRAVFGKDDSAQWIANNRPDLKVERAMSAATLSQGGAMVPIELSQTIIDLKDQYGAFRSEAMLWPMGSDTLDIPMSVTDSGAAHLGESDLIPESDGVWTNVTLTTTKVGALIRIPNELFNDSVVPLADRVALELARQFAKTEDNDGFNGDGTSTYGGISGLTQLIIDGTHNAAKVAMPSGKNKFTDVAATDLANLIASLPAYAHANAKFYCSPQAWGNVFVRLMQAVSGNRVGDVSGNVPRFYAGYPVVVSPVLPSSTGSLAAKVLILFGDLRRASAFGDRQQIRMQILAERYSDYDQTGVKAIERYDIVSRFGCGDNTTAGPMLGLIGTA